MIDQFNSFITIEHMGCATCCINYIVSLANRGLFHGQQRLRRIAVNSMDHRPVDPQLPSSCCTMASSQTGGQRFAKIELLAMIPVVISLANHKACN